MVDAEAERPEVYYDVANSERAGQTVGEWWEAQHDRRHPGWLSSTDPAEVWNRLGVTQRLHQGAVVLNIGVGMGYEARDLAARGCIVHSLDISQKALDSVAEVARGWRADRLDALPENTFDVACSHLVSQHMSDDDLAAQMRAVLRALNSDGIFALQFAYLIDNPTARNAMSNASVKGGGVLRSPGLIAQMAEEAGGKVVWSTPSVQFPELGSMWHASQIKPVRKG